MVLPIAASLLVFISPMVVRLIFKTMELEKRWNKCKLKQLRKNKVSSYCDLANVFCQIHAPYQVSRLSLIFRALKKLMVIIFGSTVFLERRDFSRSLLCHPAD